MPPPYLGLGYVTVIPFDPNEIRFGGYIANFKLFVPALTKVIRKETMDKDRFLPRIIMLTGIQGPNSLSTRFPKLILGSHCDPSPSKNGVLQVSSVRSSESLIICQPESAEQFNLP